MNILDQLGVNFFIFYMLALLLFLILVKKIVNKNNMNKEKLQIKLLLIILVILTLPMLFDGNLPLKNKIYILLVGIVGGLLAFWKFSIYEKLSSSDDKTKRKNSI